MVPSCHPEAPTEMAAMHNLGGEYAELAVVSVQPEGNKIVDNE